MRGGWLAERRQSVAGDLSGLLLELVLRRNCERGREIGARPIDVAFLFVGYSAMDARPSEFRFEADRPIEIPDCRVELALLEIDVATGGVGGRIVSIQSDRRLAILNGAILAGFSCCRRRSG